MFARQRKLFGTGGAVIFHDLTNTHMTERTASELAKFGRSKQKRNDCPLVTLALATDEGGFPRRSSVLPGNVSEPGTLLDALDSLAKPRDHRRKTHSDMRWPDLERGSLPDAAGTDAQNRPDQRLKQTTV